MSQPKPGEALHRVMLCAGLEKRAWERVTDPDRARFAKAESGMTRAILRDLSTRGLGPVEGEHLFCGIATFAREMGEA